MKTAVTWTKSKTRRLNIPVAVTGSCGRLPDKSILHITSIRLGKSKVLNKEPESSMQDSSGSTGPKTDNRTDSLLEHGLSHQICITVRIGSAWDSHCRLPMSCSSTGDLLLYFSFVT